MHYPGFEPGLSLPQSEVLTTILIVQVMDDWFGYLSNPSVCNEYCLTLVNFGHSKV